MALIEIDGSPIKAGGSFHGELLTNSQMVDPWFSEIFSSGLDQPFYYSQSTQRWTKLTYGHKKLDLAVKATMAGGPVVDREISPADRGSLHTHCPFDWLNVEICKFIECW